MRWASPEASADVGANTRAADTAPSRHSPTRLLHRFVDDLDGGGRLERHRVDVDADASSPVSAFGDDNDWLGVAFDFVRIAAFESVLISPRDRESSEGGEIQSLWSDRARSTRKPKSSHTHS